MQCCPQRIPQKFVTEIMIRFKTLILILTSFVCSLKQILCNFEYITAPCIFIVRLYSPLVILRSTTGFLEDFYSYLLLSSYTVYDQFREAKKDISKYGNIMKWKYNNTKVIFANVKTQSKSKQFSCEERKYFSHKLTVLLDYLNDIQ